jgi:uncharacterized membrane protein YraQ (UPF0718 family)
MTELVAAPARRRPVSPRLAALMIGGLVLLGVAIRLFGPTRVDWLRAALVVFGSLVIQAIPFVLVGAAAAALIEVFVPIGAFERISSLPRPLRLPAAGLAGIMLPICECGSVPVARRLVHRGLDPSSAFTFMLAAPVVNPVVIASTFYAFRGRDTLWTMVLGRTGLGLLVAMAVGWALGALGKEQVLRPAGDEDRGHSLELGKPEPRWRRFFVHLADDFLFMGGYLLLGASMAAIVQTFLPQGILERIGGTPVVDIVLMMAIASLLSLCSESDAFIAASFTQFGTSAQLAFLVFGPMVDLKLGALYAGSFRRVVVLTIVAVAAATTLLGSIWIGVLTG